MATAPKHLFIGGNARSGTTALVDLLNCHPRVLVFHEANLRRFLHRRFTAELLSDRAVDKHLKQPKMLSALDEDTARARLGNLTWLGDKYPAIHANFRQLDLAFPEATLLYIVRNPFSVVASYDARKADADDTWTRGVGIGVAEWNMSVHRGAKRATTNPRTKVIGYEDLFTDVAAIDRLFTLLGLDPAEADRDRIAGMVAAAEALASKPEPRNEDLRRLVALSANFVAYRQLMKFNVLASDAGASDKKPKARRQKAKEV
jgi:Sulfotransferase family